MLTLIKNESAIGSQHLPLKCIECFDGNPRLTENPEHERIKQSIRDSGLLQPLLVTRTPTSDKYLLEAGGNTRLRVLQELYEETADEKYADVECVVRPWVSYEHVLMSHLKENDLRGNLSFIEKALAISALEARLNKNTSSNGHAPLSQRAMVRHLRQQGYGISQSLLSYMHYAVDRLLTPLGTTLRGGLGRPSIERLRRLDDSARDLWMQWAIDSTEAYDEAFVTLCHRYDAVFVLEALQRDLEYEIAERADVALEFVKLALVACIDGDEPPAKPQPFNGRLHTEGETEPAAAADAPVENRAPAAITAAEPNTEQVLASESAIETAPSEPSIALEGLRAHSYNLALALADSVGIGNLIGETPDCGCGFIVIDFPPAALKEQGAPERQSITAYLWWTLLALSEMTLMPPDQLRRVMPASSTLRAALEAQDTKALFAGIGTLDHGQVAHRFWNALDADRWATLVDLMETYRTLRSCFSLHQALWTLA